MLHFNERARLSTGLGLFQAENGDSYTIAEGRWCCIHGSTLSTGAVLELTRSLQIGSDCKLTNECATKAIAHRNRNVAIWWQILLCKEVL
jgi:hypothetical protein